MELSQIAEGRGEPGSVGGRVLGGEIGSVGGGVLGGEIALDGERLLNLTAS